MGLGDGAVVGTTQLINNGSPSARWNLVIIGDGYKASELAQFHTNANDVVNSMFATQPFNDPGGLFTAPLANAINVYRIDVSSTDSGADDPVACGGTGAMPATYFDSRFCNSGTRRLLVCNSANVIAAVSAAVPQWHAILVLVNSTVYGGGGGAVATSSLAPGALEVALHELGHSAFGLADEYEYYLGCGVDVSNNNHPAGEPGEPNVTATLSPLKWASFVTGGAAIPTSTNANCAVCDPQGNPVGAGTVGAFEGAHYYHCGAWRPQFNCKMRALGHPFCAVCQDRIRDVLGPFRPRRDRWRIYELIDRWLIHRPQDWVVDPSPMDLSRFARLAQRVRAEGAEDDLSDLISRAQSMSETEVRTALLRIKSQASRLEAAASTLEAALKGKRG